MGWALSPSYYAAAATRLPARIAARGFTIFGDDPGRAFRVSEALTKEGYDAEVYRSEPNDDRSNTPAGQPSKTWLGFGSHRHIIMSNSTFCWWATALGDLCFGEGERSVVDPVRGSRPVRHGWLNRTGLLLRLSSRGRPDGPEMM